MLVDPLNIFPYEVAVAVEAGSVTPVADNITALDPQGASWVAITGGPSADFNLCGIKAPSATQNGRLLIVENATGHTMSIIDDSPDASSGERIKTFYLQPASGAGGSPQVVKNGMAVFGYRASIWRLITYIGT